MAWIGTACVVMAHVVVAHILMAHIVLAYKVMACIGIVCIVMADVVMVHLQELQLEHGIGTCEEVRDEQQSRAETDDSPRIDDHLYI